MKSKNIFSSLIALILLGAIAYLWLAPSGARQAPSIELTIIDGRKISLDSLRGKPILVTFWATSCPGCIKEMPHLVELYNELHKDGLEIIGIAMPYDRPDHVLEMVRQKKLPYPIALDIKGEAVRAFGNVRLTPTSFLVAPDGRIVKHKIGEMDMQQLHQQIVELLEQSRKS